MNQASKTRAIAPSRYEKCSKFEVMQHCHSRSKRPMALQTYKIDQDKYESAVSILIWSLLVLPEKLKVERFFFVCTLECVKAASESLGAIFCRSSLTLSLFRSLSFCHLCFTSSLLHPRQTGMQHSVHGSARAGEGCCNEWRGSRRRQRLTG